MLKKLNGILNMLISSFIGAFAGHVIYVCLDYKTHPGLYDMQSAPWYTGILYYGIFTMVPLIIAIIIKLFLWRKLKQKKEKE
jgi:ACR3 family arsenite efflux pump ArsB